MKAALAQIEVAAGRPKVNAEKILSFVEQAKAAGAGVVIFPATALSGRLIGDPLKQDSFLRECAEFGRQIHSAGKGIKIFFGNVNMTGEHVFSVPNYNFNAVMAADSFALGKSAKRDKKNSARAAEKNRPLVYVNATGIQNTGKTIYTFDGGSAVYNSKGGVVRRLEPFAESLSVIDTEEIDNLPVIEPATETEVAQIYRALSFGVDRFLKQIGVNKVVIGVSGGIDSAVAAALYTKVLGADNVWLVNMPSVFNSATTRGLSEQLAKNLGCRYAIVPIQKSVDLTIRQLELTPITLADGAADGIKISNFVRENIQARDRSGRVLATVAAAIGGVFTCNANKAESTIGYATMYGDAAGFLAALADLWKFQVYALANYLNEEIYGREVIPRGIIEIVPSAELSDAQNVDEGKGDPLHYDYHDYLFRAFVEEMMTPEDILNLYAAGTLEKKIGCAEGLTAKYFSGVAEFTGDLEKWWRAFTGMAVAKRIQSPPILAISRRPFGSFVESQYPPYFTQAYKKLKASLL